MAIKIGRNSPPSINVLHKVQPNQPNKSQRVAGSQTLHNDTSSDRAVSSTEEPLSQPGQTEFEASIKARGIGGKLAEQLLTLYEILLSSDEQEPAMLALLLSQNIDMHAVSVDQQFIDTVSMLSEAVTDDVSTSVAKVGLVERFAEMLKEGRVNLEQHAELEALIETTSPASSAIDTSDAAVVDMGPPTPYTPVELEDGIAHVDSPIHVDSKSSQEASNQASIVPVETIIHPLTPAIEGVDPQQWRTQYSQSEEVLGLSGPEFLFAVYGAGSTSAPKNAELLEFGRYAGSIFAAYANDDNLLFDDEVMLMQEDGVLIETDDGWFLDIDVVAERVDSQVPPIPDWMQAPLSTLEGSFATSHLWDQ